MPTNGFGDPTAANNISRVIPTSSILFVAEISTHYLEEKKFSSSSTNFRCFSYQLFFNNFLRISFIWPPSASDQLSADPISFFCVSKKLQISKQQVLKKINHLKFSKPSLAATEMFGRFWGQKFLTSCATRFAGFQINIWSSSAQIVLPVISETLCSGLRPPWNADHTFIQELHWCFYNNIAI